MSFFLVGPGNPFSEVRYKLEDLGAHLGKIMNVRKNAKKQTYLIFTF